MPIKSFFNQSITYNFTQICPLWDEPDWSRTLASAGYRGGDTSVAQNLLKCTWMFKKTVNMSVMAL